jgi:DNA-binding NtrC family response regulator
MILLITASVRGRECAKALLASTKTKTEVVPEVRTALNRLREASFSAVVIDDSLLATSGKQLDILLKHLGTAIPVFVNLAISRSDRVVRDVLAALQRVEQERALARKAVEWELRSELKGELTGILLWTQQAMAVPALPAAAETKLKSVVELADRIRARLEITAD